MTLTVKLFVRGGATNSYDALYHTNHNHNNYNPMTHYNKQLYHNNHDLLGGGPTNS